MHNILKEVFSFVNWVLSYLGFNIQSTLPWQRALYVKNICPYGFFTVMLTGSVQ